MKAIRFIIPAAAILLLAGQTAAQTQAEAERAEAAAAAKEAQHAAESREAEVERKTVRSRTPHGRGRSRDC